MAPQRAAASPGSPHAPSRPRRRAAAIRYHEGTTRVAVTFRLLSALALIAFGEGCATLSADNGFEGRAQHR